MAIDAANLRKVFGQFATGITVITTVHDGVLQGMTANSFTSVSLEPPLVLFCADKRARSGMNVGLSGCFAVSILGEEQRELSDMFAGKGTDEDRALMLESIGKRVVTGAPVIDGALGWLDCKLDRVVDAGDHVVYFGEVIAAGAGEGGAPLLYYRGSYQSLDEAFRLRDRGPARDKTTRFHEMVDLFDRMQTEGPYAALLEEVIATAAPLARGARVLDIGCGPGRIARDLAAHARDVVGIDASAAMLERGRERATSRGLANATFLEGQATALPLAEASFDVVVLTNVLYYLTDPVAALREARRVLRPGGRLVVLEPSTGMARAGALELIKAQGLRQFSASSLLAWADAAELGRRYDEARLAEDLGAAGLSLLSQAPKLSGAAILALAERRTGLQG